MDRFVNDYRDIEEIEAPLLVNQRPKRQIPSRFELELRRLDSETKSLPPHAGKCTSKSGKIQKSDHCG